MVVPLDLIILAPAAVAMLSLLVQYRLVSRSGSGMFAYSLLIAASIAIATVAATVALADPALQAAADMAIMLAGALAFAASGWLLFAFGMAGDADGR